MSKVPDKDAPGSSEPSRPAHIWQRDELLLVLKSTSRCLPLEDMAKFVDFLENVMPSDRIIKFLGLYQIGRQLEQMKKSELVEKKGACYKITERGTKLADQAESSIEGDKVVDRAWSAAKSALARLPWNRLTWDSYLTDALKHIKEETEGHG